MNSVFSARVRPASVSLFVAAMFMVILPGTAKAVPGPGVFTINIAPDGVGNVVATGSGDVNLGSAIAQSYSTSAQINPLFDFIVNGPATTTSLFEYGFNTSLTGPASFGTVAATPASAGSGSMFMFDDTGFGSFIIAVPTTYTTDSVISDSSTYAGKTLSQLGVTPGSYTWTMGTGNTENTVTFNVSATPAPEPSTFALAGLSGAMLLIRRIVTRKQ